MERCISLFGYIVILGLAWVMSSHRNRVPWRIVIGGTLLQFSLAFLVLKTEPGRQLFSAIGDGFTAVLGYTTEGARIVFPDAPAGHFAFRVLPTIIFVSCLMSVLYHLGVMQWIVQGFAWLMQRTLGTSGAETLSCSANIFMGQTEAPLLVRPFLPTMTLSELNAVMVGGFATIAGGVMAVYISFGVDAGHLVTASVISAPAALLIAKLMLPETELPKTRGDGPIEIPREAGNIFEAATIGASEGVKLAINVAAMLIAFTALVALLNGLLGLLGSQFGQQWTIQASFSYLFAPMAWLMGIAPVDCLKAGEFLGIKMALNEFIAYQDLGHLIKTDPAALAPRTVTILTYALCGFSNFTSIGIQIGGLGSMSPERRGDLARLGLRAMIGGTLACNLTACVAGAIL